MSLTALLIATAALEENVCYLFAVGANVMVQSAVVAGVHRRPEKRGIHLESNHIKKTGKVIDVLMDIESAYSGKLIGRSHRDESFPGELKDTEMDWWNGEMESYDDARLNDIKMNRGIPWLQRRGNEKETRQRLGGANIA